MRVCVCVCVCVCVAVRVCACERLCDCMRVWLLLRRPGTRKLRQFGGCLDGRTSPKSLIRSGPICNAELTIDQHVRRHTPNRIPTD